MQKTIKLLLWQTGIACLALFLLGGFASVQAQQIGEPCSPEGARSGNFVCQGGYWSGDFIRGPETPGDVIRIIRNVTDWVFKILMAASVIFIILAGFQFVTEGKDPAKVVEARTKLLYAVAGIAIALLANGFESAVRTILGVQ